MKTSATPDAHAPESASAPAAVPGATKARAPKGEGTSVSIDLANHNGLLKQLDEVSTDNGCSRSFTLRKWLLNIVKAGYKVGEVPRVNGTGDGD